MTISPRERLRVAIAVLGVSAVAWMILLLNPGNILTITHCPTTDGISRASLEMMFAMNPIVSLVMGWALMLAAMMSPTLIPAIIHVRERSFRRRRFRSVGFFVVGYASVWIAAGGVLIAATLGLYLLAPQSLLPALGVGITALIWQCSPAKQRCLNRSRNHRELAAFGIAADVDAFRFGVAHGVFCFGSCWALMLLPMLVMQEHFVAMAFVMYVMTSEHLEKPRPLQWEVRLSGKIVRTLIVQIRLQLQTWCQAAAECRLIPATSSITTTKKL
jgi:predicted metal-binding membrane protein